MEPENLNRNSKPLKYLINEKVIVQLGAESLHPLFNKYGYTRCDCMNEGWFWKDGSFAMPQALWNTITKDGFDQQQRASTILYYDQWPAVYYATDDELWQMVLLAYSTYNNTIWEQNGKEYMLRPKIEKELKQYFSREKLDELQDIAEDWISKISDGKNHIYKRL